MHTNFPVAVHIFLIRNGKILLMRRYNTGYEDGNFSVVAGHIEHGESAKQASIREVWEEVGIRIDQNSLKFVGAMFRKSNDERMDLFLTADMWLGEPYLKEPEKCNSIIWADMINLPNNTIMYVRKAIENFLSTSDSSWIQEFGWDTAAVETKLVTAL